jgi:hypothetical protein
MYKKKWLCFGLFKKKGTTELSGPADSTVFPISNQLDHFVAGSSAS